MFLTNELINFSKDFRKISNINFKIHPIGTEMFCADGQADRQTYMTKLIFAFRNFTNAPKNVSNSSF